MTKQEEIKFTCQYIEEDESGEYMACFNTPDRVPCIYKQFGFCPPDVPDKPLIKEK